MLTEERQAMVLSYIKKQGTAKIQELVELTGSSESTIRRDLSELEKQNVLKRLHGGASLVQGRLTELGVPEKSVRQQTEKERIARYAASLVEEGDSIFLDAGTTTQKMIAALPEVELTVVTNGLMHVDGLMARGFRTFLTGGFLKPRTRALIGKGAAESIRSYRFDKAFLGANGIHPLYGYTTPDPEEAFIKELSIAHAREAYVLSDHSKIGDVTFAKFGEIREAALITDEVDTEMHKLLEQETDIRVVGE